MRKVEYHNWERILLDTGVIIKLIHSLDEKCQDTEKLFVKHLVNALLIPRPPEKDKPKSERVFCISAITLSELLYKAQENEKTLQIIRALNTANVEFLPFNDEVADYLTVNYHPYLGKQALNSFARNG